MRFLFALAKSPVTPLLLPDPFRDVRRTALKLNAARSAPGEELNNLRVHEACLSHGCDTQRLGVLLRKGGLMQKVNG